MGSFNSKPIQIILVARHPVPGFKHRKELPIIAQKNETFGDLLERFNTFRGPDSQINNFFDMNEQVIQPDTIINTSIRVYIN